MFQIINTYTFTVEREIERVRENTVVVKDKLK